MFQSTVTPSVQTGVFASINTTADSNGTSLSAARPGASFHWSQTDNAVYLNYVAIPEPSTWAIVGIGIAFTLWNLRRRGNTKN